MVEVPGIPKDKLDIKVSSRQIRIEGEAQKNTEQKKSGYVRRERGYSKLETTIAFPEEVIPDKAEANVNNGVLEIRVPKRSPTEFKERKIEVK
jgi:HSP20 family protein